MLYLYYINIFYVQFAEVTDKVQGEKIPTVSYVAPAVKKLRTHLTTKEYNTSLVKALLESLNKRLSAYEVKKVYQRAAVLDPQFKLQWVEPADCEGLTADITTLLPALHNNDGDERSPPRKKASRSLFDLEDDADIDNSELDAYLNEKIQKVDPLSYWKDNHNRFPQLATLAMNILSIPASSAPVERKVFRPDRACLTDVNFENLMYNKCYSHMLK